MKASFNVTYDGYTYKTPLIEIESFSVLKKVFTDEKKVFANIYIKEESTGYDNLISKELIVDDTNLATVENAAITALQPEKRR